MVLCTTLHTLLGKSNSTGYVSTFLLSAMVTSLFRAVLLLTSLYLGGNSSFVKISPPALISAEDSCPTLTIVEGRTTFSTYHKSEHDVDIFLTNLSPMDQKLLSHSGYNGGGGFYYQNQNSSTGDDQYTYILGYGKQWVTFSTVSNTTPVHLHSYDQDGYLMYYYYCGDVSLYLNTVWVPVMAWIVVNILLPILLSSSVLLLTIKSKCALISCTHPGMMVSDIFSHLHVGPVSYCKSNSGYLCLSKTFFKLNILLSLLGMCLHLHMITTQFGPGDTSAVQVIIPILTR